MPRAAVTHQQRGEQEAAERQHAGKEEGLAASKHTEDQDRHGDDRQRDLRQRDCPVHQRTIPATWTVGVSAAVWCCTIDATLASQKLVKLDG